MTATTPPPRQETAGRDPAEASATDARHFADRLLSAMDKTHQPGQKWEPPEVELHHLLTEIACPEETEEAFYALGERSGRAVRQADTRLTT